MHELAVANTEEVERALLMIARHVPVAIPIGKPTLGYRNDDGDIAIISDLKTPPTMWYPENHRVCRLVELNHGATVEFTEFRNGDEMSRKTMTVR